MSAWIPYVGIFLCSTVLEIGWIAAVRFVTSDRTWVLIATAMMMQSISNASTLILVSDGWTALSAVAGSGFGALLGMKFSFAHFSRSGGTHRSYNPSDNR